METGSVDEHRAYLERLTADSHIMPIFVAFNGELAAYLEFYWVAVSLSAYGYSGPAYRHSGGPYFSIRRQCTTS
jgi:acetyl CoA:N6-hydroxylysine acetyl transferase